MDVTTREYFLPRSLDEAVGLLAEHGPSLLVMSGGTLAMPLINEGVSMPEMVMGLRRAGLSYLERVNGSLIVGAATTLSQVVGFEAIPVLQEAAYNIGGWAIRNMGTVGGNLFAPPPGGDFAVALLALDAQLKLVSARGERTLPLAEFYTGFMTTALEPDELVAEIRVPVPAGRTAYLKYGRRHTNTPAVVTVAAHLVLNGKKVEDARLALNAVGPHPIRATQAEALLTGSTLDEETIAAAAAAAAEECEPFTDPIASAWYRRRMVNVFVRRALSQIAQ
ncbi:MAG TPA: xanthine dehydrogenase family protein subunit M [Chloroflexi bacterium]|nr:xanthine dehydrogenase family protein subunit M [Chloroflexota bacterium]